MFAYFFRLLPHNVVIGSGLIGFAAFFALFAMILLGDRPLLLLANMFFFPGLGFTMGWIYTIKFLVHNYRCSICFIVGIILIYYHLTILGAVIQGFGCVSLLLCFSNSIIEILRMIPMIGSMVNWLYPPPKLYFSSFMNIV